MNTMVLTDTTPFARNMIQVLVRNKEGKAVNLEVSPEWTVEQLKETAIEHLSLPTLDISSAPQQEPSHLLELGGDLFESGPRTESSIFVNLLNMGRHLGMRSTKMYRLLHIRTGKIVYDESSIKHENIVDGDEFILYARRTAESTGERKTPIRAPGPSKEMIDKATAGVTVINDSREPDKYSSSLDFNTELRRLLIPLIEISQKLLSHSNETESILQQATKLLEPEHSGNGSLQADSESLKQLQDMGFPPDKAKLALLHNNNHVGSAAEWILRHTEDDQIWSQLSDTASFEAQPEPREVFLPKKITDILDCFRKLNKTDFQPDMKALFNLQQMGFSEADVVTALRLHGNDQSAACEWLISDRSSPASSEDQSSNFESSLEPDSSLYVALRSSAAIHLALNKPKTLIALLQILKRPTAVARWLSDPDIGPLLLQLSRIYHDENRASQ